MAKLGSVVGCLRDREETVLNVSWDQCPEG